MLRWTVVLFLLLFVCSHSSLILDEGLGINGMQVGGAYTANPKNGSAIYWNPANLAFQQHSQLFSCYTNQFSDIANATVLYSVPLTQDFGIGLGYLGLQVSGLDYLDGNGQRLGSNFIYNNNVFVVAAGKQLTEFLSLGFSLKLFSQKAIGEKSCQSLDVAGKVLVLNNTSIGFVVENAVILNGQGELFSKYRAGIEQPVFDWTLSADCVYDTLFNKMVTNYGFVFAGIPTLEIKGGFSGYLDRYFVGLSFKIALISLDYMYSNPDLGSVHSIGIAINW